MTDMTSSPGAGPSGTRRDPPGAQVPVILDGHRSWRWYRDYLRDPLACMEAARARFGKVLALGSPIPFRGRGRRYVLAFGPEANRLVLGQPDLFRSGGQVLPGPKDSPQRRMRQNIFAMNGEEHRRHRRIMQPPLTRQSVAQYAPSMASLIDQFIDRWQAGVPFEAYDEMLTLSNWIAARLLFGHDDFQRSIDLCHQIIRWIELDVEARRLSFRPALPGTAFRRLFRHAHLLEASVLSLIEDKRRAGAAGDDLVSILIRSRDEDGFAMSDSQLIAHSVILHGAAFLTTGGTLAWTLYLIAQHPQTHAALDAEVAAGLRNWPPSSAEVDAMPLLDGCVREALRLLPPVHHTFRTATEPTELLGVAMRTGDRVVLSAYGTQRDPELYPEPDRFDPGRWARGRPGPYDFIPFSGGPRLCLGYSFAMLEMKMIVARIVQRYRIAVVPQSRVDAACRLTLCPLRGVPMTISPRDGAFARSPVSGNILELVRHG